MSETYSRVGSISIKKETTENVAVTPDTFIPFNDEGITDDFSYSPSMPVAGNRAMNIRAIKNKIPAPNGPINLNVEPKTFGHFLHGICGGLTSGVKFTFPALTNLSVGNTITNGSTGSALVVAIIEEELTALCSTVSGDWAAGNTATNGGTFSQVLGTFDDGVYGHIAEIPQTISATYSVQKNYADRAIRYMGVKFHNLDALGQSDNIITAGVQMMARSMFRHAKVTAITSDGAGAKTITVDQTQGLVAADSIKLYRPGTGFMDFSASTVKTHAITSVTDSTHFVVTNLQTATAVGDLIVLAPQTPSYTVDNEFAWIGGASAQLGTDLDTLSTECLEDFTFVLTNELEERHCVTGTDFDDRFPGKLLQKSLQGNGSFTLANEDEDFIRFARTNTAQALKLTLTGSQIGTTGLYYQMKVSFAEVQFDAYQLSLAQDDIVNEEVPYSAFYNASKGFLAQVYLVNDIASY